MLNTAASSATARQFYAFHYGTGWTLAGGFCGVALLVLAAQAMPSRMTCTERCPQFAVRDRLPDSGTLLTQVQVAEPPSRFATATSKIESKGHDHVS